MIQRLANPPIQIDKNSPVPLYHQIQEAIKSLIQQGKLQVGERIPSENDLAKQFDISPMTVRQALNGLVQEGYIYRRRGRGTFVAQRPVKHPLDRLVSFTEEVLAHGFEPSGKILFFGHVPAEPTVAQALNLADGTQVLRIKRLRFASQSPVSLHDAYLRDNLPITREELKATGSLYQLLAQKNIHITGGVDEIRSISADDEMSEHLHVKSGAPMLQLRRITEDRTGAPIEYVIATYRAGFYHYTIRLKR
ncbi:MAG: GntR family transcriptional regulator [Chloroflexi bacterium]|nr:GntR family transcriptional regulator [Chloroflexota bacterium]